MIVQAAIRVIIPNVEDIQILPLHRHGDSAKTFKAFGFKPGECRILEQGFIDEHGDFYDRKEALKHVKETGQKCKVDSFRTDELFSEDLY